MVEIVRTADILGGTPRIEGTRVSVLDVHELVVAGGNDPADDADQLDLSLAEIYAALAYFYGHPDEMRAARRANEAVEKELADRSLNPPKTAE